MPREFLVVSDSYWYKVSVKRKMKTIANIANPANRWVLVKKQQVYPILQLQQQIPAPMRKITLDNTT